MDDDYRDGEQVFPSIRNEQEREAKREVEAAGGFFW